MPNYTYLIVGGGMTADAAIRGIREVDPTGSIGLIGADSHPPYDRPPLVQGALERQTPGEHLAQDRQPGGDPPPRPDRHERWTRRTSASPTTRGRSTPSTSCSWPPAAHPAACPFGGDEIIYFRTLDDYERLRALTAEAQRFAVIGGGFIGSEVAAALAMNGKNVVMAFPAERHRQPHVPARPGQVPERLLPPEGGRSPGRRTA